MRLFFASFKSAQFSRNFERTALRTFVSRVNECFVFRIQMIPLGHCISPLSVFFRSSNSVANEGSRLQVAGITFFKESRDNGRFEG